MRITTKAGNLFKGDQFYGGFQEWGWDIPLKRGGYRHVKGVFMLKRAADSKRRSAIMIYKAGLKRRLTKI